ncbi:hypothetical protein GOV03_02100 [Candidatus Woesearchaeota archaeon]|nr:hypothetical protein [Candidatus Woesearchaeota archaeon]
MYKERIQPSIYFLCKEKGSFISLTKIDYEQIQSMVEIALIDLASVQEWENKAVKGSGQWNALYKLYYDVLHQLAEVFIHFDKIKVKSHECLFAYLCEKHPELELDWNFFEKIRTKRNGALYYGALITYKNWKEVELQFNLYIKKLKEEIERKLKDKNSS